MNLLKAELENQGYRPIWFNAWHHQEEEHFLASLDAAIRKQAAPPWWHWQWPSWCLCVLGWQQFAIMATLSIALVLALGIAGKNGWNFDPASEPGMVDLFWLRFPVVLGGFAAWTVQRSENPAEMGGQPSRQIDLAKHVHHQLGNSEESNSSGYCQALKASLKGVFTAPPAARCAFASGRNPCIFNHHEDLLEAGAKVLSLGFSRQFTEEQSKALKEYAEHPKLPYVFENLLRHPCRLWQEATHPSVPAHREEPARMPALPAR